MRLSRIGRILLVETGVIHRGPPRSAEFFIIINNQWFNNLQWAALLTSSVEYDKILCKFGQQQLVMANYACGFNQSETGKYFK